MESNIGSFAPEDIPFQNLGYVLTEMLINTPPKNRQAAAALIDQIQKFITTLNERGAPLSAGHVLFGAMQRLHEIR